MVTIEVDDQVYEALKGEAEPFEDTPNSVLRRKFDLPPVPGGGGATFSGAPSSDTVALGGTGSRSSPRRRARRRGTERERAPAGSLLPETAYELPILRVLEEGGGRGATQEVVTAVGALVDGLLTSLDREETPNGGERWQSRVQFARLRMVERGWIAQGSPRGVWEITEAGRAHLRTQAAS